MVEFALYFKKLIFKNPFLPLGLPGCHWQTPRQSQLLCHLLYPKVFILFSVCILALFAFWLPEPLTGIMFDDKSICLGNFRRNRPENWLELPLKKPN